MAVNAYLYIDTTPDVGEQIAGVRSVHAAGDVAVRSLTRTYASASGGTPYQDHKLTAWVPYWLLLLIFAPLPLWVGTVYRARRIRASRRKRGLCAACGYDLRASPGRCPECGARAKSSRGARLKSLFDRGMGRAGIEPATHGFSVHCSTS